MKLPRLILLIGISSMLAACDYSLPDDGTGQEVIKDQSGQTFSFGNVDQVSGSRFFTLPIYLTSGAESSSSLGSGYKGADERNRLIVDSASGESRRILPDQSLTIVNWIVPTSRAAGGIMDVLDDRTPAGPATSPAITSSQIYVAVIKRPAPKKELPPTYDVLLGQFETGQQQWIAQGLTSMESVWITPEGKLAMVAATKNGGVFRLYDPKSFRQLLETKLSI